MLRACSLPPVGTDLLTDEFPQHVVCEWLGNSEKVAEKHYLHVTDEHMSAACGYSTEENVVSNVVLNLTLGNTIERLVSATAGLKRIVST